MEGRCDGRGGGSLLSASLCKQCRPAEGELNLLHSGMSGMATKAGGGVCVCRRVLG